jgi:hypothetical protein
VSYCKALRTSEGGCGIDVDACEGDCELWIKDNENASCSSEFDDLLSCTSGVDDYRVCESTGQECQPQMSGWLKCVERCRTPGEVVTSPACSNDAPCKSGTELTIKSDKPLDCDVRVVFDCGGGVATGWIPAGDPATASGTLTITCPQASECHLRADAANYSLEGASSVNCIP